MEISVVQFLPRNDSPVCNSIGSQYVIADLIVRFRQRRKIFPPQSEIQRQIVPDLPVVLKEQRINARAEPTRSIRQSAGIRVHSNGLKLRRIIGQVQQRAKLVQRPRSTLFVVIVLVLLKISTKPQRMPSPYLRHRIPQVVSILRKYSRRVPALRRTQIQARAQSRAEVEYVVEGNSKVSV